MVAKAIPDPEDDIPDFSREHFLRIMQEMRPESIFDLCDVVIERILMNICDPKSTDAVIDQSLTLFKFFVDGANTV